MSQYRQIGREYVRASELLLEVQDLTDAEQEQIGEMLERISAEVLLSGIDTAD